MVASTIFWFVTYVEVNAERGKHILRSGLSSNRFLYVHRALIIRIIIASALFFLMIYDGLWHNVSIVLGNPVLHMPEQGNLKKTNKKESNIVRVRPLADDFVKVFESPDPQNVYCYSPGIARCPDGRPRRSRDAVSAQRRSEWPIASWPMRGSGVALRWWSAAEMEISPERWPCAQI